MKVADMTNYLRLRATGAKPIVKCETFFKQDVDFETPAHYVLVFAVPVGFFTTPTAQDNFLQNYPMIARKSIKLDNSHIGVVIRTWNKRTSSMKISFTSKFGPFDLIYKAAGSYERKYGQDFRILDPERLNRIVSIALDQQRGEQRTGFFAEFSYVSQGYVCTASDADLIKKAKTSARTVVSSDLYANNSLAMHAFFRCKYTLTRWFWGKKAALEKIAQDRVRKYLNKDKQDLQQAVRFLGSDLKLPKS